MVAKKMAFRSVLLCSFVTFLSSAAFGFQDGEPMRFETPKMNEEEQHSPHTPKSFEMTCDACTAIAYQMSQALQKAEDKRPSLKGKPLPESDILDVFETVCDNSWDELGTRKINDGNKFSEINVRKVHVYGLKTVHGVNRLSGPGLEAKDFPGMMQGGGKWPGRLAQKCGNLVGDIGEEELYVEYRKSKDLLNYLCKEYTKDCVKKAKQEL